MKKVFILFFLTCVAGISAFAQDKNTPQPMQLMARYHQNRVELRWAPTAYNAWKTGNTNGYFIKRIDENASKSLTPQPLKPLTLEQWATQTDTTNKWNKAAAQLIYGKMNGLPASPGLGQIKEISRMQQYALANALIAADLSSETAHGMAMAFTDKDVVAGKTYIYRVWAPGVNDTASVMVSTAAVYTPPAVTGLFAEEGEHNVTLKWSKAESEHFFTAFWVEKSTDNGRNFKRLHQDPLFVSGFSEDGAVNFFIDSVLQNYQPAQYRVFGITAWGETGSAGKVVTAQGRDRTPPGGSEHIKATSLAANKIRITWDAVVNENDLAGWYIRRGNDPAGIFTNVNTKPIAPQAREFFDTEPFAFNNNFYQVVAVDTAGNESTSFSALCYIIDSIPPAAPTGLTGMIDSTGTVILNWDIGKEPDLRGYRVYLSNASDREYQQLTVAPILQNYFVDTIPLKTLTEKIYYRIVAVDYRFNHSGYSGILTLEKPDIVPPVPAVFKGYQAMTDSVLLKWANSTSADAVKLTLWRKNEAKQRWETVADFKQPFPKQYADRDADDNTAYTYALEVTDDDGLSSGKSAPLSLTTRDQKPAAVVNLTASFEKNDQSAKLQWTYPTDHCRFVILCAGDNEELHFWKSTEGKNTSLTDALPKKGKYRYAVKALLANGGESEQSKAVEVIYD